MSPLHEHQSTLHRPGWSGPDHGTTRLQACTLCYCAEHCRQLSCNIRISVHINMSKHRRGTLLLTIPRAVPFSSIQLNSLGFYGTPYYASVQYGAMMDRSSPSGQPGFQPQWTGSQWMNLSTPKAAPNTQNTYVKALKDSSQHHRAWETQPLEGGAHGLSPTPTLQSPQRAHTNFWWEMMCKLREEVLLGWGDKSGLELSKGLELVRQKSLKSRKS